MQERLAYVGNVIKLAPIEGADFILSATVVCGAGGRWIGIVQKGSLCEGDKCMVYLPDCLLPECDEFRFMEKRGWRVRMQYFKGSPSEVLITPLKDDFLEVGYDASTFMNVTKFFKEIPANLKGVAKGNFPCFVPKTDELNYQMHYDLVDQLAGKPYYITEKADGSSTTAFRHKGEFGVCSRNLELKKNYDNGFWSVAKKYNLEEALPEGVALQWETIGPKIQGNQMGTTAVDGRAFSAYNTVEHSYLPMKDFLSLCVDISFPTVDVLSTGNTFDPTGVSTLGEGYYSSGKPREGVVVRSQENLLGRAPISFKVINLHYGR